LKPGSDPKQASIETQILIQKGMIKSSIPYGFIIPMPKMDSYGPFKRTHQCHSKRTASYPFPFLVPILKDIAGFEHGIIAEPETTKIVIVSIYISSGLSFSSIGLMQK